MFCYVRVIRSIHVRLYHYFILLLGLSARFAVYLPGRLRLTMNWPIFQNVRPSAGKCLLPITKTCLYNFDPQKPHFYIAKLVLQGYAFFYLYLLKNIDCGYSLEPPRRGGSNEHPQSMFLALWKNIRDFYLNIFSFWR